MLYMLVIALGMNVCLLFYFLTTSIPITATIGILTTMIIGQITSSKLKSIFEDDYEVTIRSIENDFYRLERTICKAQAYKLSNSKRDIIDVEYTTINEEIISEPTKEKDSNYFLKEFDKYNNDKKNNYNHRCQKEKVLRK